MDAIKKRRLEELCGHLDVAMDHIDNAAEGLDIQGYTHESERLERMYMRLLSIMHKVLNLFEE